jgi:ATP-binding cassette subfamily B protein
MTLLGEEGVNISGGQKQLVSLARALYKNPDVIVIDEGTSAMDRATESFVLNLLNKLKKDKAIFVITHRMKVASLSDYIYILRNGQIEDEGEPDQLVNRSNFYSSSVQELLDIPVFGKRLTQ